MASGALNAERDRIQREIEELERNLGLAAAASTDVSFSESENEGSELEQDEGTDGGAQPPIGMSAAELSAEREKIQREIEELERSLGPAAACMDVSPLGSQEEDSEEDEEADGRFVMDMGGADGEEEEDLGLPEDSETCLQINLVYQEVIEEKLQELEVLLAENREQQNEILSQLSVSQADKTDGTKLPPSNQFLGHFLKPYFKDKTTGLGPPPNPDTREKMAQGIKSFEDLGVRKWKSWEKALLRSSVVSDSLRRLLQPKLSRVEYLTQKMEKANGMEKQILEKQISQTEKEIEDISRMPDDELIGNREQEHDWEKISNIDFEGLCKPEELRKYWQNHLHMEINKKKWSDEELERLKEIAANHNHTNWDKIAEELGTNRRPFMCLQMYQLFINTELKKKYFTKEEDQVLTELVEKMRIGSHIPYTKISYFMEGREAAQLIHRYTHSCDPALKRGPWSSEEDALLIKAVAEYGPREWWKIQAKVPGRTDAQCRDRYMNCLSEDVKKGKWCSEEETLFIDLVNKHGVGRWAKIASEIPNRTDSQCLHKWNTLTKPKKRRQKLKEVRSSRLGRKRIKNIGKLKRKASLLKKDMLSSSDSEEMELSDSVEEGSGTENDDDSESESEEEEKEEYTMPSIDLWIPVGPDIPELPRSKRPARKRAPTPTPTAPLNPDAALPSPEAQAQSGPADRRKNMVPPRSTAVASERSTVLKGPGYLANRNLNSSSPAELTTTVSQTGNKILKLTFTEVRKLLRPKSKLQEKTGKKKKGVEKQKTTRAFVSHLQSNNLNQKLMMAVTPWMENVLMPKGRCKRTEADVIRERAEKIGLATTPVFTLFITMFQIDAEGCRKVIEERAKRFNAERCKKVGQDRAKRIETEGCIQDRTRRGTPNYNSVQNNSGPLIRPTASSVRTVAQVLYEKRLKEARMKKRAAPHTSILLMPSMIVPQTVVIQQPLIQVTPEQHNPSPVIPTEVTAEKPNASGGGETGKTAGDKPAKIPPRKRQRTSKTKHPEGDSSTHSTNPIQIPASNTVSSNPIQIRASNTVSSNPIQIPDSNTVSSNPIQIPASNTVSSNPIQIPDSNTVSSNPIQIPASNTVSSNPIQIPGAAPSPMTISWILTPQGLVPVATQAPIAMQAQNAPQSPVVVPLNQQATQQSLATDTPKRQPNIASSTTSPALPKASGAKVNPVVCSAAPGSITNVVTAAGQVLNPVSLVSTPSIYPLPTSSAVGTATVQTCGTIPSSPGQIQINRSAVTGLVQPNFQVRPLLSNLQGFRLVRVVWPTGQGTVSNLPARTGFPSNQVQQVSTAQSAQIPVRVVQQPHPSGLPASQTPAVANSSCCPPGSPNASTAKANKISVDLNLMFQEDEALVKEWLRRKGGVRLPKLNVALPYLPPSVFNLTALLQLLGQKKSLEEKASILVSGAGHEDGRSETQVDAIRSLVAEKLDNNPAYLLLKARFLACFTLPAFLATVPPVSASTTAPEFLDGTDFKTKSQDRRGAGPAKSPRPQGPMEGCLETAPSNINEESTGESSSLLGSDGVVASEFIGMRTRRSTRLKKRM
ncbi:snRNA-activating protein complex subunit 4-like isoform X2 [Acipenser ruthenus]|uniref:snRNA-activating protein complex subunit 4-like isoform X2 n=1 Tax=Acipenser ruthenus TaxID=7906 RepID=UPI002741A295|nr:snRNA-activating protein complex subunit 4-like isoform X2 [Acipenser ruthenus]